MLAGGNSSYVCLYDVNFQILLKKFKLTNNRSIDGLLHKLNSQYKMDNLDNKEDDYNSQDSDYEQDKTNTTGIELGNKNKKKNLAIKVSKVVFSYTNRSFCIASTEGIFYFSLDVDNNLGLIQLEEDITPKLCLEAFKNSNYTQAITYAIYLNLSDILDKIIISIEVDKIEYITSKIPFSVTLQLFDYFAKKLDSDNNIQLNLIWVFALMKNHKNELRNVSKDKSKNIFFNLNKSITKHYKNLTNMLEENVYTLEYLIDNITN